MNPSLSVHSIDGSVLFQIMDSMKTRGIRGDSIFYKLLIECIAYPFMINKSSLLSAIPTSTLEFSAALGHTTTTTTGGDDNDKYVEKLRTRDIIILTYILSIMFKIIFTIIYS